MTGPDGLLRSITKTVLESALEEEMTEHLGYDQHDPAGRGSGNIRNGTRTETVLTDAAEEVEIEVPRDRAGTVEPVTAANGSGGPPTWTRWRSRCTPRGSPPVRSAPMSRRSTARALTAFAITFADRMPAAEHL